MTSKIPNPHQLIYVRDFIPKLCYIIKGCLLLFLTTIQITTILLYSIYIYTTQPYSYSYPTHIPCPTGRFSFSAGCIPLRKKNYLRKKSFSEKKIISREKKFLRKKVFSALSRKKIIFLLYTLTRRVYIFGSIIAFTVGIRYSRSVKVYSAGIADKVRISGR